MVNNLILVPDIQEAKCSEFTVQTSKKCIGFQVVKNYKKENYNIKEWKQIFNNRQFRKMKN